MTIEERVEHLKSSIKHNKKVADRTQRLLEKEESELKKLEKKICICPACNKMQELKSLKVTHIICKYCGYQITKS